MKKRAIGLLITFIFILPIVVYAASILASYGESVTKANNYIMSFRDRRKYLIFNKNYVYERDGFGDTSAFTMGGLLSKSEYDLSVYANQSYLSNGKEYWTLTDDGSNKYYIDAYVQSKNPSSLSGTRVTEYVKPGTIFSGRGTYSNPWIFDEGYAVDIISNNTNFGTVSPLGERYVRPGESLNYVLTPANGYYYNGKKDECSLIKVGSDKYENNYRIENIQRDITCTAVYELRTYKFDLLIKDSDLDYNGVHKTYATDPVPNPLYFKYRTNWYSNANTSTVINGISTVPVVTGWTFGGYYYGSTKVIESNGNLSTGAKDLNLGTTRDFVDTDHVLYADITKNTYTITFTMNSGKLNGSTTPSDISATYDEIVNIANPLRAGYQFDGWSFNGNSTTAKTGTSTTTVSNAFTANSTKTQDTYFVNLTPTNNGTVTLTANWTACPAGTYNDGTKTTCTPCAAGKYSRGTANTQCTSCVAGSYAAGTGNTTCAVCGAGKTSSAGSTASTSCTDCAEIVGLNSWATPSWNSSNNTMTNLCTLDKCNAGYKKDGNTCVACGPGTYSASVGSTTCTDCTAGKFSSGEVNTTCTTCVAGSYSGAKASACTACGAGKTSSAGAQAASSCKDCSEIEGLATWATTTWNTDNTMTGLCTVGTCAAGRYKSGNTCPACGKGKWSAAGATSCTDCPSGYRDGSGTTSESNCKRKVSGGHYMGTARGTTDSQCAAGTYKEEHNVKYGNTSACAACPSGQTSSAGATSCHPITYTRKKFPCNDGTWTTQQAYGVTTNCSSLVQTEYSADINNQSSYVSNCDGLITSWDACNKLGVDNPCYAVTERTRSGCNGYSSSSIETLTGQTDCEESTGTYYKYTCEKE